MAAVTDDKYSLEIASIEASVAAKSVASDVLFDAKGDLIVGVANNSAARVVVGANGTVLKANSATSTGVEWGAVSGGAGSVAADVIFDVKGDLPVGTGADAAARLPVGANGTFLKTNSATATGLEWTTGTSSSTHVHSQASASVEWVVNHNLGFNPVVAVSNTGGQIGVPDVVNISVNQLRVYFQTATAGEARCV